MAEAKMPAAEANEIMDEQEVLHYEFSFHVLPTVAEGEVNGVVETLKKSLTKVGAIITNEEKAERLELAYSIRKSIDGTYYTFGSAYFGWIRFTATPDVIKGLSDTFFAHKDILRFVIVKLNKVEEENPFFIHESLKVAEEEEKTEDDKEKENNTEGNDATIEDAVITETADTEEKSVTLKAEDKISSEEK